MKAQSLKTFPYLNKLDGERKAGSPEPGDYGFG